MIEFIKDLFKKTARKNNDPIKADNIYFKVPINKYYGLCGLDFYYGKLNTESGTHHSSGFIASNPSVNLIILSAASMGGMIAVSEQEFNKMGGR